MASKIAITIVLVAVLVGAFFVLTSDSDDSSNNKPALNSGQEGTATSFKSSDSNVSEESASQENKDSNYVAYSESAIADAAEDGRTVLFFHADWCPTCRSAEKDILKNGTGLPSDVTIVKTNYDTEIALKDKYNIAYQHTFVQVDAEGNEIAKWGGGGVKTINQNLEEV